MIQHFGRLQTRVQQVSGILVGLCLCLGQARTTHGQCPPDLLFSNPTTGVLGDVMSGATAADFNGDGAIDLAMWAGTNLWYFQGASVGGVASGAFTGPQTAYFGFSASRITAGDFNGDSRPDLAVAGASSIGVSLNRGDGTFESVVYQTGVWGNATALETGDFNSDGLLDLAVALPDFQGGPKVGILLGNGSAGHGTGTFAPLVSYPAGAYPTDLDIGDFNSDGASDLVVTDFVSGVVSFLPGNDVGGFGDGTFGSPVPFAAGLKPNSIASADFNGDSILDLAIANGASYGAVTILRGNGSGGQGDGTFGAPESYSVGAQAWRVTATDLNGDGIVDILVSGYGLSGTPLILLTGWGSNGVPTGTFSVNTVNSDYTQIDQQLVADFNDDQREDLVITGSIGAPPNFYRVMSTFLNGCLGTEDATPQIASISDVPLDQGGRVKVTWDASGYDRDDRGNVSEYWIWRSTPASAASSVLASGTGRAIDNSTRAPQGGERVFMRAPGSDGYWEFVAAQPAGGLPTYAYVAATMNDSTGLGNPFTAFLIQARTLDGTSHWDSDADSGYSVDNLPPRRLRDVGGYYAPPASVTIHWSPSEDEDLSHYVVYSGTSVDFSLNLAHRRTETADTVYTANSFDRTTFFKVTAVDIHGNESEPITLAPAQVTGIERLDVPAVAYLAQNHPNPFNPETAIAFGVPEAGRVTLRVYSSSGRLVRTLLDEDRPAGADLVRWDGKDSRGIGVPSGVYVARLDTPGSENAIKMVLVR